jgi:SNF2 family DNA or RNA helicase
MVDGKTIVFCQFDWTHDMLLSELTRRAAREGRKVAYLKGGMSTDEISEQKRLFNEDDSCREMVMKVQLKYGHTLLGSKEQRCSTTVYFENMWSLNTRAQSEDRNHRHGQDRMVTYVDFVSSPVERKAVNALVNKRSVSDEFMTKIAVKEQA